MNDIIELSDLNIESNSLPLSSTNFGSGIELLMNSKVKESKGIMGDPNIHLDDLNNLENELNDLSEQDLNFSFGNNKPKSDLFNMDNKDDSNEKHSVKFSDEPSIGKSTADTNNSNKTWDGFDKFNNIPMNPDKNVPTHPQMSKEELLRDKFKFLRKLEALEKKGIELSKKYTMDSSLQEMQGEYETIIEEKEKSEPIKIYF